MPCPIDCVVTADRFPYGVWDRITGNRPGAGAPLDSVGRYTSAASFTPSDIVTVCCTGAETPNLAGSACHGPSAAAGAASASAAAAAHTAASAGVLDRASLTAALINTHIPRPVLHFAFTELTESELALQASVRKFLAAELPRGEFTPGLGMAAL